MLEVLNRERFLLAIIFLSLVLFPTIHDPDFYFHLVAGNYISDHATLPHIDVFSHSNPGRAWIMHEWLFELLIYELHQLGGLLGVQVFIGTMVVATLATLFAINRPKSDTALTLLLLTTAALLAPYITPRPQLFSYLFFSLYLLALFRCLDNRDCRHLKWLPLLMLAWVNLHGGYILGIVLIGLFLVIASYRHFFGAREEGQQLRALLIILALTLGASLLNPYFASHWLFPFHLVGADFIAPISEWRRPELGEGHFQFYLLFVLIFFIISAISLRKRATLIAVIPLPFIAASFLSVRHIPLALLVMTPLLVQHISVLQQHKLPPFSWFAALQHKVKRSRELGRGEFLLNWILLLVLAAGGAKVYPALHRNDAERINRYLPVKATDFIEQAAIEGNMFNTYRYGGYLLYRLYPRHKVFIDIRADMYGSDFIAEYGKILFAKPGWEALVKKYEIDFFVCDRFTPIAEILKASPDYSLLYEDNLSIVAVRNPQVNP
jgi:hypothetical protein